MLTDLVVEVVVLVVGVVVTNVRPALTIVVGHWDIMGREVAISSALSLIMFCSSSLSSSLSMSSHADLARETVFGSRGGRETVFGSRGGGSAFEREQQLCIFKCDLWK